MGPRICDLHPRRRTPPASAPRLAWVALLAALVAALLCAPSATAQYALPRSVFGCGGQSAAGADNRIAGTLGQTLAGIALGTAQRNYIGFWWTLASAPSGAEDAGAQPAAPHLAQNYPNPFRDATTISFRIGARVPVRLSILDLLGRERVVLVDGMLHLGGYTARFGMHGSAGPSGAREELPPGLYIIRLVAGAELRTVRCVLCR
jgi:hypothetical protein